MEYDRWAVSVPVGYRVGEWRVVEGIATGSWGSVYRGEYTPQPPGRGVPLAGGVVPAQLAGSARRGGRPAATVGPADTPAGSLSAGDRPEQAALKFLPTGTVTTRQLAHLAAMVDRELTVHRSLRHPKLVHLFETLTVDDPSHPGLDGATVLVMELAEGSLADVLSAHGGGPVPDAPRLIAEMCEGLAFLHEGGWVHGDLKPANVLRMADASIRLTDFGLATELDGTHGYLPGVGSPDFLPPERRTEPLTERGVRVRATLDVWALGVTAHLVLTGRHPFPGSTVRARVAAAAEYMAGRQELTVGADLSPGWRAFIAACLAPDHARRRGHEASTLAERARQLAGGDAEPGPAQRRGQGQGNRRAQAQGKWRGQARGRGQAQGRAWYRRPRVVVATAAVLVAVAASTSASLVASSPEAGSPGGAAAPPATATAFSASAAASRWLDTEAGIPEEYLNLIIEAGTMCDEPAVHPALVAAMLEAESGFDPDLSDPAKDEYGIARWTPRVLQYYLPAGRRDVIPAPPFSPEDSIPAVGRYLCRLAPQLEAVPGQPELLVAAAYRTSAEVVRNEGGVPGRVRAYTDRVQANLARYAPKPSAG